MPPNPATTELTPQESAAQAIPAFIADTLAKRRGEYVALHTARRTYLGRLVSVTSSTVMLESDSDELDHSVLRCVDTHRIEAVDLMPR